MLEDTVEGLQSLVEQKRIQSTGRTLRYVRTSMISLLIPHECLDRHWKRCSWREEVCRRDNRKIIARAMLMTTDPGDLVLDPTSGSGTTASLRSSTGAAGSR